MKSQFSLVFQQCKSSRQARKLPQFSEKEAVLPFTVNYSSVGRAEGEGELGGEGEKQGWLQEVRDRWSKENTEASGESDW